VRQLEAFFENVPSPVHLLTTLETNPSALEILVGILGGSPYLAETLLRSPEYFYWLLEKQRLERVHDEGYFSAQAEETTRPFGDAVQALGALRRLRRRESLRIGAQDILGITRMQDTVTQISDLAQVLLQQVFEILARERLDAPTGFAVVALGKLGGRELICCSSMRTMLPPTG
jgi:glutamate-ammonia-ligase adenylyltransferase